MNKLYYFLIITGCEKEKDCENQCNGHCSNNLPCNSSNGHCSNGCAPGYVGTFCNNSMYTINISIGLKYIFERRNDSRTYFGRNSKMNKIL